MCRQDPKAVTHPAQTHTSLTTQAHVAFSLSTTSTFVGTSCPISHFCLTPSSQTTCFAPGLFERRLARGVDLKDPHIDGHELRRSIIWSRWSDILIASRKELRSKRKVAPHLSGEGCYILRPLHSASASASSTSSSPQPQVPDYGSVPRRTSTASFGWQCPAENKQATSKITNKQPQTQPQTHNNKKQPQPQPQAHNHKHTTTNMQ